MRRFFLPMLALVVAMNAWGQRAAGGFRTYGSPHGFGNVLYPGVGTAPPVAATTSSFAHRLGRNVAGLPVFPNGGHRGRSTPVVVPYPVYVGGYGYGYTEPAPQVMYVQPPPQQLPQIIINHHYTSEGARPVVRDYMQEQLPESSLRTYEAPGRPAVDPRTATADEREVLFLVALKDGTIYPAVAYWVEGNTLNYVTLQGSHNRVTLDLVDRQLSARLNSERSVDFALPGTKK